MGIDIDLNVGDIDICYSDIGGKYVGLKIIDIGRVPISTLKFIPISDIKRSVYSYPLDSNPLG